MSSILPGWSFRKPYTLPQSVGEGSNKQCWIIVHYGTGVDLQRDVYLHGKCNADFSDLRVVDGSDSALLEIGILPGELVDGDYAILWFTVSDDFDAGTIKVYLGYGNPGASSVSNPNSVFDFYDTFPYDYPKPELPSTLIYNGIQDFSAGGIECPNGDLLVAWENNPIEASNAGKILASRSTDGGDTWTEPYALQDTDALRDFEPQFLVVGTTVFFFYTTIDETDADRTSHIYYKTSADNGASWSGATEIECKDGDETLVTTIQNPIIKSSAPNVGRIVLPIGCGELNGAWAYHSSVVYSDNNGSTWTRGGDITGTGKNYLEPSVVELSDGSLYALLRDYGKGLYQYESTSDDGGDTWTTPSVSPLASSDAQAVLIKLSNDHIIALWNDYYTSSSSIRQPLVVAVSTDDCATFSKRTPIRNYSGSESWSNMGLFLLSSGKICAPYSAHGVVSVDDIYIAVFEETDLSPCLTDKWNIISPNIATVSSGVLTIDSAGVSKYLRTPATYNHVAIRSRHRDYTAKTYPIMMGLGFYVTTFTTPCAVKSVYTDDKYCLVTTDGVGRGYNPNGIADDDAYHTWDLLWKNNVHAKLYVDDVLKATSPSNIPSQAMEVTLGHQTNAGAGGATWRGDFEWVLARKYNGLDPVGTWGAEESLQVGQRARRRQRALQLQIPLEARLREEVVVRFPLTVDTQRPIEEAHPFALQLWKPSSTSMPLTLDARKLVSSSDSFHMVDVELQLWKRVRALALLQRLDLVKHLDE